MRALTEALISLSEALYSAILVGNPAQRVARMSEWVHAPPHPGDLVLEVSTGVLDGSHRDPARIGAFLRTEVRAVCEHERADVSLDRCATCPDDERSSLPLPSP